MWDEEKAAFIRRQNVRVDNRHVFTSAKHVETTAKFTHFIDKLTDNEKLCLSAGDIVPETWYNFEERVERECRLSQNSLSALKVDFLNKLGHQFSLSNDEVLIVLRYYTIKLALYCILINLAWLMSFLDRAKELSMR